MKSEEIGDVSVLGEFYRIRADLYSDANDVAWLSEIFHIVLSGEFLVELVSELD